MLSVSCCHLMVLSRLFSRMSLLVTIFGSSFFEHLKWAFFSLLFSSGCVFILYATYQGFLLPSTLNIQLCISNNLIFICALLLFQYMAFHKLENLCIICTINIQESECTSRAFCYFSACVHAYIPVLTVCKYV